MQVTKHRISGCDQEQIAVHVVKPGSQSYGSATLAPVTHNQHRVFAG